MVDTATCQCRKPPLILKSGCRQRYQTWCLADPAAAPLGPHLAGPVFPKLGCQTLLSRKKHDSNDLHWSSMKLPNRMKTFIYCRRNTLVTQVVGGRGATFAHSLDTFYPARQQPACPSAGTGVPSWVIWPHSPLPRKIDRLPTVPAEPLPYLLTKLV